MAGICPKCNEEITFLKKHQTIMFNREVIMSVNEENQNLERTVEDYEEDIHSESDWECPNCVRPIVRGEKDLKRFLNGKPYKKVVVRISTYHQDFNFVGYEDNPLQL